MADAEMASAPTTIDALPRDMLVKIFKHLSQDSRKGHLRQPSLGAAMRTCARWRKEAADDEVWKPLCEARLKLTGPDSPARVGAPSVKLGSYMAAMKAWIALLHDELQFTDGLSKQIFNFVTTAPVWQRAVATYEQLSGWAEQALPEAHSSLAPPASNETWSDFAHDVIDRIAAKKDGVHDWPRGMSVDEVNHLLPLRFLAAQGDGQQLWIDVRTAAGNGALNVEAIQGSLPPSLALAAASKTDRRDELNRQATLGLLGGYSAYDHLVSMKLLPLKLISGRAAAQLGAIRRTSSAQFFLTLSSVLCRWTNFLRGHLGDRFPRTWLMIAATSNLSKFAVLDYASGQVRVGGGLQTGRINLVRAVPKGTAEGDDLLTWLGEHTRRLAANHYAVEPLVPGEAPTRGLSLYPRSGAAASRAVTRGVLATAQAVYAPEQGMWVYSIRLSLLAEGMPGALSADERGFETCQLRGRHWLITDASGREDHVNGDGVVGLYPLLRVGGWRDDTSRSGASAFAVAAGAEMDGEFVYQSQSGRQPGGAGSFEGELFFVPGSLKRPAGDEFAVRVERFELKGGDDAFVY